MKRELIVWWTAVQIALLVLLAILLVALRSIWWKVVEEIQAYMRREK